MVSLRMDASNSLLQAAPTFVSIAVPCFNEESGIAELVRRCSEGAISAVGENYEIILVDDGSSDGTWLAILGQFDKNKNLIAIRLSRNFGHQVALTAGLSAVNGTVVFVIDADLQDPPELLGVMLRALQENEADVVYGRRRSRAAEGWLKKKSASMFYRLLQRATDVAIPIDTGDFRLMSRRVSDLIAQMPERDRFIRGMVASVGFKQIPFEYDRQQRFSGETKYPLSKMVSFAADAFLGYSMTLLRFSSIAALGLLVVLFFVAIYSIYAWLYLEVTPGWTSLMISIIVASFFQLISLSIIGEYVGRIYLSTKARPLFIVDAIRRSRQTDRPTSSDASDLRRQGGG
jgi:glycosyltransferase involved in cell wall biosynthesis